MGKLAARRGTDSIYYRVFKPRTGIGEFFYLADCLVLLFHRETWGIVINEALYFAVPLYTGNHVFVWACTESYDKTRRLKSDLERKVLVAKRNPRSLVV